MATYKDKNKLINDSKDVYISDYDKALDYSYLSDIIDQKRAYKSAEAAGDSAGMKKANDRANNIRIQAASYTAGEDGSKYNRVKRPYEENRPKIKKSVYDDEVGRVYNLIAEYGDFDYDVYSDPLYQTYKDIYLSLGDEAYERSLAENALRTGGVASTSAISAAAAAKNRYNKMLSDKIPELYDKAYDKYNYGLESLYNMLDAATSMSDDRYSRYRDEVKDYETDRDYYYEKDKEIADNLYDTYRDETDYVYNAERDMAEDSIKQMEMDIDRQKMRNDLAVDREKNENKRLSAAVSLAKTLSGRYPASVSTVNRILQMLK